MRRTWALLSLLSVSVLANAECELPGLPTRIELSPQLKEARYRDYIRMCLAQGGTLLDGQATHLGKRFRPTSGIHHEKATDSKVDAKDKGKTQKKQGTALVGAVIDETGKPTAVSLIGTSGDADTDKSALEWMARTRFTWPARLDKKPVKVYESYLVLPIDCPTCEW